MSLTFTGEGINYFRIVAMRSGVELEGKLKASGMKQPFRRSLMMQAIRELGLPRGTKRDAVLAALDVAVEAQKQVTRPGIDIREN